MLYLLANKETTLQPQDTDMDFQSTFPIFFTTSFIFSASALK